MPLSEDPYRDFRQAADRPEDEIDLGRAALTIARPEYPGLDVEEYLARIDALADQAAERGGATRDVERSLAALRQVLFAEHRFCGNRDDYYDPKNSFLNEVLERKTGIPISLSILFMEVGRRIGLDLAGVGFPGHFLVRCRAASESLMVDPFDGGELRSNRELERMLRDLHGKSAVLTADLLRPASKKRILKRMLANLRAVYLGRNDLVRALSVLDRAIILDPASGADIRDRGIVYFRLECAPRAREDFLAYLRLAPNAEDAAVIREHLAQLSAQGTTIH